MAKKSVQNWQDKMWNTIVTISSFPGFILPISLYALLIHDVSIVFVFLLSMGVLAFIQMLIKYFFPTPRPVGYIKTDYLLPTFVDSSFPSNHAAGSFLLYFFVQATIPQLHFVFLFFALLVGLSRVHLHKHHPIDVIGGFMTAYFVFFFAVYVVGIFGRGY
jgi:membrane-associated phospholipid phosphatase